MSSQYSILRSPHSSKFAIGSTTRTIRDVCLEAYSCPAHAHVEKAVSVEVSCVSKIDCMWASMLGIQVIISSRTATASPLVCFTCLRGGTATPTSSVSASPGMFYVPQGVAPPAQTRLRRGAVLRRFPHLETRVYRMEVPWTSAATPQSSPMSSSSPASSSLSSIVRTNCPSIVGDFRRVSVRQLAHQLVDQVDERRVLVSVKKLITNINE